MKGFRGFIKCLIIVLLLAGVSFAQNDRTPAASSTKFAVINRDSFYDKNNGITELVNVVNLLTAEFKSTIDELNALKDEILKLGEEIDFYSNCKGCRINWEEVDKMRSKYEALIDKYKTIEAEARPRWDKRWTESGAIVEKKIAETIKQFAKEKSYIIFDRAAADKGIILGVENDLTEEFIRYYNERFVK
jgi:hypothetical protein